MSLTDWTKCSAAYCCYLYFQTSAAPICIGHDMSMYECLHSRVYETDSMRLTHLVRDNELGSSLLRNLLYVVENCYPSVLDLLNDLSWVVRIYIAIDTPTVPLMVIQYSQLRSL